MEHEIHCPPERMWELFFSTDFNVEMYEQGLGFPSCKVPELTDDGEVLHRRMVCTPKVDLPAVVAKIVGDKVGYEEIGDWVRSAGEWRWTLVLAAFGDKVRIVGVMRLVPHGQDHCLRKVEFEVDAKVFGVGKIVENTATKNVRDGWDASAKWINGYLARHPA
jgi:hypothetical protein